MEKNIPAVLTRQSPAHTIHAATPATRVWRRDVFAASRASACALASKARQQVVAGVFKALAVVSAAAAAALSRVTAGLTKVRVFCRRVCGGT